MKRKCLHLISSKDGRRGIYVDERNAKDIIAYLNQDERHKKKFQFIAEIILSGLRNTEVYDKENINGKTKDVTAMKFFKGQDNDRIYCKEIRFGKDIFIVVAAVLYLKKKTQKLNHHQKNIIEKIGGYKYEF
jgi:hypothetical protein